jgi:predicted ester cyclase
MSRDDIAEAFERSFKAFNRVEDRSGYFEIYDPAVILHDFPSEFTPNLEGAKDFYRYFWQAFPDGQATVEDRLIEGNRLAYRYSFKGTHQGEFGGADATGKQISIKGMTFLHFANGKCIERWQGLDEVGLRRQLGLMD